MDQLEWTIACKDEKDRHSTLYLLRRQGSLTDIGSGAQLLDHSIG